MENANNKSNLAIAEPSTFQWLKLYFFTLWVTRLCKRQIDINVVEIQLNIRTQEKFGHWLLMSRCSTWYMFSSSQSRFSSLLISNLRSARRIEWGVSALLLQIIEIEIDGSLENAVWSSGEITHEPNLNLFKSIERLRLFPGMFLFFWRANVTQ